MGDESWVPFFKILVFFSCVSFSIIVPSIAPYLARMGAEEYVLGVAVAVYSLGEMIGSTVFGQWMTVAVVHDPGRGVKRALMASIAIGCVGSVLYVVADAQRGENGSGPALVVLARLLCGIWTGGKMVVEQTYIGEASAPERNTAITTEVSVYAVLGFVVGPSIGALFSPLDVVLGPSWVLDQFTAPGYFLAALCGLMLVATAVVFDPLAGYHVDPRVKARDAALAAAAAATDRGDDADEASSLYGAAESGQRDNTRAKKPSVGVAEPDKLGLAVLLFTFFAHFYSFAIQETITTPFVSARFGWTQRQIDYLFAGVGLLSLAASYLVTLLAKCCSDQALLVLSMVMGLVGSLLLIDEPLAPDLGAPRFFVGFALITCAFPFGRNIALAMFSKVLGPTPQGAWFGLCFVVGAIPRCIGPSWSLYALHYACVLFPQPDPCPPGGRSCLEFAISSAFFAAGLLLVKVFRLSILPFDDRHPRPGGARLPASPTAVTCDLVRVDSGCQH